MKISKSKSGRTIVSLDGYSEGYKAFVAGALTGAVSIPAGIAEGKEDWVLEDMAKNALQADKFGTAIYDCQRLGIKIMGII
jgi:hypothetical protein